MTFALDFQRMGRNLLGTQIRKGHWKRQSRLKYRAHGKEKKEKRKASRLERD